MSLNGRLPSGALVKIPSGRLTRDAGFAWLDMRDEIYNATGLWIVPGGPNSSYRTYPAQVYFWNLWKSGRGNPAAYPGTSNHGWGRAVDVKTVAMAAAIRRHGAKFRWNNVEGARVGEWWHMGYVGGRYTRRRKLWYCTSAERRHVNELQTQRTIARRNGGWSKVDGSHLRKAKADKAWLEKRCRAIHSEARRHGWAGRHRRIRYYRLRQAING